MLIVNRRSQGDVGGYREGWSHMRVDDQARSRLNWGSTFHQLAPGEHRLQFGRQVSGAGNVRGCDPLNAIWAAGFGPSTGRAPPATGSLLPSSASHCWRQHLLQATRQEQFYASWRFLRFGVPSSTPGERR